MTLDNPKRLPFLVPGTESQDEDTTQYLQEACYYLHKKGLTFEDLAKALEIHVDQAKSFFQAYESKIRNGQAKQDDVDRTLWEDVYNDSVGNEKLTFVRDDGFYHCRRTELEQMDSSALMAIFEKSKQFLDFDMYKKYLGSKPPVGYDPMALQRQVKRAVELIEEILNKRWANRKNQTETE